jgi:DegV family protein with EDD domain
MVKIVTDTTAGLPHEVAERYGIPVIPQIVSFGADSYLEGIELDNAAFMERLRSSRELPKTAAPPVRLFVEAFERLVPLGEPIVCVHPSALVSGTVRSAIVAAAEFPGADIRVVDTRVVASPMATMVELAARWAEEGADADTIVARLEGMTRRCSIYFLVATLEYLAKGGRIGGASALLGTVLRIKPILTMRDGQVEAYDRQRTQSRALARLKELVALGLPSDGTGYLSVMHAGVPAEAEALAADLCAQHGLESVPIFDVPPAIVTHGGPGILGVGFFTADDSGESGHARP